MEVRVVGSPAVHVNEDRMLRASSEEERQVMREAHRQMTQHRGTHWVDQLALHMRGNRSVKTRRKSAGDARG